MDTGESLEGGLGSLDSTQRSPVLTPVYTSDAAREIIEEMRRQDMISARRAVPRHKRRHITISCSQPLVLEALTSDTVRFLFSHSFRFSPPCLLICFRSLSFLVAKIINQDSPSFSIFFSFVLLFLFLLLMDFCVCMFYSSA